jgi:alpha-D-ribose 1-methylphosphonate 5-triphosphate diphosphatase
MLEQFERNMHNPLVTLVSLMDHTPGARQFASIDQFREYYMSIHKISDTELDTLIAERKATQAEFGPRQRQMVIDRCRSMGITMASHDDTTSAHIEEAAMLGISISEFPTTLEAAQAAHRHGMMTIMGAPNMVRGGSHSGNVAAHELASQGLLDVFSSDYVPSSLMEAGWLLHERLGIEIPHALATVTRNPARMLGLTDRGSIEPGKRADLVWVRKTPYGPVVRQVWREGMRIA